MRAHLESAQYLQEEALRRFAYVDEFHRRTCRSTSHYVLAVSAALLIAGAVTFAFWPGVAGVWYGPLVAGLAVLYGVLACTKPAPVCPNCSQDITTCEPVHCHICGKRLDHGRCARCGVDVSWTVAFRTVSECLGNQDPITYCPGCGVLLQSQFRRHSGDED